MTTKEKEYYTSEIYKLSTEIEILNNIIDRIEGQLIGISETDMTVAEKNIINIIRQYNDTSKAIN